MNLALARASRPPADMNKFPERQPVQFCVLWTNPEVNKSEGVGVGTAFRQMVNFLEFYSELAGSLIHPLIVGEKISSFLSSWTIHLLFGISGMKHQDLTNGKTTAANMRPHIHPKIVSTS